MKILLIGNYEYGGQESMQRFAQLLNRLLKGAGHDVRHIQPKPFFGRLKFGNPLFLKWLGYIDQYILFPLVLPKHLQWAELVHICDHSNAVFLPWVKHVPNLITCHDLLAIRSALGETSQHSTGWSGRILQQWILSNLKKANFVVCDSEQTCRELLAATGIKNDLAWIVPVALNYPYKPMEQEERKKRLLQIGLRNHRFFLHVGGNQWYKNRLGALKLFSALRQFPEYKDYHLVMAGKPWTREMREYVAAENLQDLLYEVVGVENEDLRALYSSAEALLFPSYAEGFGWPIVEAQACGCPVVTTGRPPMNDIGGDAAIYIDPQDISDSTMKIIAGLGERSTRAQSGLRNVLRFSESSMLEGYLEAYSRILTGNQTLSENRSV